MFFHLVLLGRELLSITFDVGPSEEFASNTDETYEDPDDEEAEPAAEPAPPPVPAPVPTPPGIHAGGQMFTDLDPGQPKFYGFSQVPPGYEFERQPS